MRSLARKLALQTLFQHEFTDNAEVPLETTETAPAEALEYARTLVRGVIQNRAAIDPLIQSASPRWKMERMNSVDRNVLRLAVFEMKFAAEKLKPSIAIDEAVELAKTFGGAESGAFVNGLLDQIRKESP